MTSSTQTTKNSITLKGSAAIIAEYLSKYVVNKLLINYININNKSFQDYGINSILFQRGIYPPETFVSTQQYGITLLMSKDDKIEIFLKNVLDQVKGNI